MSQDFVEPDEWNFLMDNPRSPPAPAHAAAGGLVSVPICLEELKMLRDAGVQTVLEFVDWAAVETKRGDYDWTIPDEIVSRLRGAGLKGLLLLPHGLPEWLPNDWLAWSKEGRVLRDPPDRVWLSPWHEEAQACQNRFIALACGRYDAVDMLCIQSQAFDGESLVAPNVAGLYDPAALRSYGDFVGDLRAIPEVGDPATQQWMFESLTRVVLSQQKIYCESHPSRTVWMQLHPAFGWGRCPVPANFGIVEYWQAIEEALKPDHKFHLLFTYFIPGFAGMVRPLVTQLRDLGVPVIAGSEWPEGLNTNTASALAEGLGGLLTSPTHPHLRRTRVEPWMVEAFRNSRRLFEANRLTETDGKSRSRALGGTGLPPGTNEPRSYA